jgi:hypothetical protein
MGRMIAGRRGRSIRRYCGGAQGARLSPSDAMTRSTARSLLLAILLAAALFPGQARGAASVHLRGTAYEFNNTGVRLAGATIRVVEDPRLHATTAADGTYDLAVPDRARVTPYIVAAGHHTIHLQTFTTDGEDLRNVNFQTPSEDIYRALAALLSVPLDGAGNLRQCAIVSTFSTVNVRALDFAGFIAYGAHGVAGATATTTPDAGRPIYFNASVLPDRSQRSSSADGGVIWTGVPAGVYTIRAQDPHARFASFVATCAPGRIVNANPPWGLHQLAPASPARISATWRGDGAGATLRTLGASRLPARATVRITCTGRGCPAGATTLTPAGSTADLRAALGAPRGRLRRGQTLSVEVTAPATDGLVVSWTAGRAGTPRARRLCVPLGLARPRPCG